MKKLIAMLLVLTMVLSFAACAKKDAGMSHADYMAAANDTEVVVETYVQAHQSWWEGKVTVYCQSPDGAYFLYNLACSEEDAAKLVPGTKIRVTGFKGEWSGEVEIMDGTFEFVKGDSYIAEPLDVTDLLGTDRQILSGIAKYYKPEELVGKTLVAITNLPPRKMMGKESSGMLLSAIHTEKGEEKLNLVMVSDAIPAGAKLC